MVSTLPTSTAQARPTARARRSTDDSNTSAAPHSGSATSPTTSPDRYSSPADSDHDYTLDCEAPGWFFERPAVRSTTMTNRMERPLLFLDVDGTLIPFGASWNSHGAAPDQGDGARPASTPADNPLLARLDATHGVRLLALGCELVWATAWMEEANDDVSPRIGLPSLPVVIWPDPDYDAMAGDQLHWKTRDLIAWAAGRTFIWVDDEITDADRAWVMENHRGHALLHRVQAHIGLTDADYRAIQRWLSQTVDLTEPSAD